MEKSIPTNLMVIYFSIYLGITTCWIIISGMFFLARGWDYLFCGTIRTRLLSIYAIFETTFLFIDDDSSFQLTNCFLLGKKQ